MRRVPYVLLTPAAGGGPRVLLYTRVSGAGCDPAAQMAVVRRYSDQDRQVTGVVVYHRFSTAPQGPDR